MGIGKQGQASRLNDKAVKEDAKNAFINAKREAFMQRKKLIDQQSGYLLCGISGDPGTGKTGLSIDCRTEEERDTHWVFILDFDEGAEPTWRQHWSSDDKVFIYNPHVYKEDMTVDYMATADMARYFMGMVKKPLKKRRLPLKMKRLKLRQLRQLYLTA